jgi:hypothetical protein
MTLTQPDLRPINTKEWKLWEDWTYEWEEAGLKCRTIIQAGQITDMASIPKVLWWIGPFQPDGLHRAAADWHDRAYSTRGVFAADDPADVYQEFDAHVNAWVTLERTFSRAECDQMFLKIMLEAGETPAAAKAMYYAVRTFGWMHW